MALTQPRKEAHRKVRKGKNTGTASRCNRRMGSPEPR